MGYEAPGLGETSPAQPQARPAEAIGAPLEAARSALLDLVAKLGSRLGEHAQPLLEAARGQLADRSCRIAVIGQIKAGKSTFINALSRRPGLLPTDINPWTVVVTALHFRNGPTPPEHAAVFHLFSVDEWRELVRGERFVRWHAATLPLVLHRTETEAYRANLSGRMPAIYVVLRPTELSGRTAGNDIGPFLVTASPYEAEGYLEGDDLV